MAEYSRSNSYSCSDNRMQLDIYREPYRPRFRSSNPDDKKMQTLSYSDGSTYPKDNYLRSYSVSNAEVPPPTAAPTVVTTQWKLKKGKSTSGLSTQGWSFNDPEVQRRKRVAGYKVYSVEGKVKGGFRRSCRWVKNKYIQVVDGWW